MQARPANITLERPAGSHTLRAAAQRERCDFFSTWRSGHRYHAEFSPGVLRVMSLGGGGPWGYSGSW